MEPERAKWDLTPPKIDFGRHNSHAAQFTDISEGKDEINFDENQLKEKLERLLEQINRSENNTNETYTNTPGAKSVLERLTELEDRLDNATAECNDDGTITITF
jgi:23S rRNA A2030 N6-methylase RlmJ